MSKIFHIWMILTFDYNKSSPSDRLCTKVLIQEAELYRKPNKNYHSNNESESQPGFGKAKNKKIGWSSTVQLHGKISRFSMVR